MLIACVFVVTHAAWWAGGNSRESAGALRFVNNRRATAAAPHRRFGGGAAADAPPQPPVAHAFVEKMSQGAGEEEAVRGVPPAAAERAFTPAAAVAASGLSVSSPPPPASTTLATLRLAALAEAGPTLRLATDLDVEPGAAPPASRPALLLPASAVRRCLAPWFPTALPPTARPAWEGDREAFVDGGAAGLAPEGLCARGCRGARAASSADAAAVGAAPGSAHARPAAPAPPPLPARLPPLFTACPPTDDLCVLEALLCESTPVVTAGHAARLASLLVEGAAGAASAAAVSAALVAVRASDGAVLPLPPGGWGSIAAGADGGGGGAPAPTPPPHPPLPLRPAALPPHSPAGAAAALDALLDGHVPLTVHPREGELIAAVFRRPNATADADRSVLAAQARSAIDAATGGVVPAAGGVGEEEG